MHIPSCERYYFGALHGETLSYPSVYPYIYKRTSDTNDRRLIRRIPPKIGGAQWHTRVLPP